MKVLETERLRARWFQESDAAFILALMNDPAWLANIGDRGLRTVEDARKFITDNLQAAYWRCGLGLWALERKSDGELVGMGGLVERDSLPLTDVGYALAAPFRGQGYAREVAAAALAYGRDVLGKRQMLAIVNPANRPSIRVLESLGMRSQGERVLAGDTRPIELFAWGEQDPTAPNPQAEIDDLCSRLFAYFCNHQGSCHVSAVPALFTPGASITIVRADAPQGVEVLSVRDFLTPRAARLLRGQLSAFEERELTSHTSITGQLAHRASRYTKAGMLDGVAFQGVGTKHFQLVHTSRGWKIAALAWQDD